MKKIYFIFLFTASFLTAQTNNQFITSFEKSNGNETATYNQTIAFYKKLAASYPEIKIFKLGDTDIGKPLHLVVFNTTINDSLKDIKNSKKFKLFINNGIHPGEPDGIDASQLFLRELVQNNDLKNKYNNVIIAIIPIYNIGGSLNRNSTTRVNQIGPKSYGFRGNSRNYDLNRDFIKCDTKNARSFAEIFHIISPDIFVDTHVSNGADYQYILTHLFTQHNKLGGKLGDYLHQIMRPQLLKSLLKKGLDATPYVNVFNKTPETGFSQFLDYPRYSTGYTTLFNTLGLMVETHMLKPYKQRVNATYNLLVSTLDFLNLQGKPIRLLRTEANSKYLPDYQYPINWKIDSTKHSTLQFKGYNGESLKSAVTGKKRLFYDRSKPYIKPVTYYDYFKPSKTIIIPKGYIIPSSYYRVIERLKLNGIKMALVKKDTLINVETLHISSYKTSKNPFEGHYMHFKTKVIKDKKSILINSSCYYVPTHQKGIRYLLETLEPEAPDSFFNWNFFDTILQRKEGFSPYVFEDLAETILKENPDLKYKFEIKKKNDSKFKANWYAQLDYIYSHSKYLEKAYLRYPIFRVMK